MNQEKHVPETKRRNSLGSLCSVSGLLLSVVCCVVLVHVEFRIQEHHRLLSHPTTFCDQMEEEILRKVQKNFNRWAAATEEKLSGGKGKYRRFNCYYLLQVQSLPCMTCITKPLKEA